MAHLVLFEPLSFAACIGQWQPLSSALSSLKARPLRIHMHAIRSEVVKELTSKTEVLKDLTPKERHHLRKKEDQKKIRKIRKERRAKRQVEERAKIHVVKPNPALMKLERPVQKWNIPWRKNKAVNQDTTRSHHGLEFDERKTIAQGRKSPNSHPAQSLMTSWNEFEAAYQQKMFKSAGHVRGYDNASQKIPNTIPGGRGEFRTPNMSNSSAKTVDVGQRHETYGLVCKRTAERHNSLSDKLKSLRSSDRRVPLSSNFEDRIGESKVGEDDGTVVRGSEKFNGIADGHRKEVKDLAKDFLRQEVENPRLQEEQEVELSEFWDRQDMLFNERFNRESMKEKFESSGEAKKLRKEERLAQRKAFRTEIARVVIGKRKGENVYLSVNDVTAFQAEGLPRGDLDEMKQMEWLANQLNNVARPDGVHFSRLIRSGGLKITDGRAVVLVQKLGEVGNWRCAMQVVEWLNSRNHFPVVKSRFVFTTLLAVLGKARRPIESLNVFNVMKEHVGTYPDMASYHIIAVTLGQAGHMEELFELMQSLRQGPDKNTKYVPMLVAKGRLIPDIVVYNAALNSCVQHKHWRCALWILDQLHHEKDLWPNSASYGLAIEVMVKAGKFDLAWMLLGRMELGGFHPNSLTYKVLVEGLGRVGKADKAVEMVKEMEQRGMVPLPGVYYALACALCMCGRWKEALLQVDRLVSLSKRPAVQTYTGFINACKEVGRWQDAISVFEYMQEVCAPNIGTCNIMISLYGQNKMYEAAKKLFDQLQTGRISLPKLCTNDPRLSPDIFTYDAVLGACALSEKWDDLGVIFRQMLHQGFKLNSKRHTWIVERVSTAGKDDLVTAIFNHLKNVNDVTSGVYLLMINSCLSNGELDKAFGHLDEMIKKDMMISTMELQKFQEVGLLLFDEDRFKFINKVEALRVTSDFNFKKLGKLSSLRRRNATLKLPKQLDTLSNKSHEVEGGISPLDLPTSSHEWEEGIATLKLPKEMDNLSTKCCGGEEGIHSREHAQNNLQTSSGNCYFHKSEDRSVDTVLSTLEVNPLPINNWPSISPEEDCGTLQRLPDFPGWELLWKHSIHAEQTSSELQLLEKRT